MNIYEKLQQVRVDLQNANLKKSGENKFAKYKYYELADFLPTVVELMNKHKLFTQVNFFPDMAELVVIDTEKTDSEIKFTSTVEPAELKGCTKIQALGATQTYIRRYLYINALDIVESDVVDSQEPIKKVELSADKVKALYTIATKSNYTNEDVKEIIKKKYKIESTKHLTVEQFKEMCKGIENNPKVVENDGK